MPLFKSKPKLSIDEEVAQIRAKYDEKLVKSRAKFDIDNIEYDNKKAKFEQKMDRKDHHFDRENKIIQPVRLSQAKIAEIRAHTDKKMIEIRDITDHNLAICAFLKKELHGVKISEKFEELIKVHITEEGKQEFLKENENVTEKELRNIEEDQLKKEVGKSYRAIGEEEIAQRNERIEKGKKRRAQIDAHNKAVLTGVGENISDIHSDHRQQRSQMRNNASNRSRNRRN